MPNPPAPAVPLPSLEAAAPSPPVIAATGSVEVSWNATATTDAAVSDDATISDAADAPINWATLWLTDRDIAAFTLIAAVVLGLSVMRWGQLSGWGAEPVEIERLAPLELNYRLDPNTATWVELAELDGLGESLAVRIVEYRETHGPYRSVEELGDVKGIGPKTLDKLRPWVQIRTHPAQPFTP